MSTSWKHAPQTVRPRLALRSALLICLLAAGFSAAVVYVWGYENWIPKNSGATYTATAYVVERPEDGSAAEIRIPVVHADADPQHAEKVANELAERCVADRRAEWNRRTEGPCLRAHEAAKTARREQTEAQSRLEAFRQQMAEAAKPQSAVQEQKQLAPPMIDNPRWVDLERQLSALEKQRDKLLVSRTPLHPAVQDIDLRIDDLKQQMAAVPRQIAGQRPSPEEPAVGTPSLGPANEQNTQQDQQKLDQLTAALQTARQACQAAEVAEQEALARQKAGPRDTMVPAKTCKIPAVPDYGWWRLMGVTLAAGLLMALGVGTVLAATRIEPPAASVAQVQADARATVVGTIPADDPLEDPIAMNRCQTRKRRALAAMGLILIAASPAAAILGIMGIMGM